MAQESFQNANEYILKNINRSDDKFFDKLFLSINAMFK